jgi:hypothetical protein
VAGVSECLRVSATGGVVAAAMDSESGNLLELQDPDTAVVFGDVFYGIAAGATNLFGAELTADASARIDRLSPV